MKSKQKHIISITNAEKLLEKYYDGNTSAEEEKQLRAFLLQPGIPEQFEPEKAIFGYFEDQKQKPAQAFTLRRVAKWSGAAAAAVVGITMGLTLLGIPGSATYAYVDGKKITDMHTVELLAFKSISNIASENTEVEENLNNLTNNELLEDQLGAFSGIEF